jgi:hypothetical protein
MMHPKTIVRHFQIYSILFSLTSSGRVYAFFWNIKEPECHTYYDIGTKMFQLWLFESTILKFL